jgi:hypothetical protein
VGRDLGAIGEPLLVLVTIVVYMILSAALMFVF